MAANAFLINTQFHATFASRHLSSPPSLAPRRSPYWSALSKKHFSISGALHPSTGFFSDSFFFDPLGSAPPHGGSFVSALRPLRTFVDFKGWNVGTAFISRASGEEKGVNVSPPGVEPSKEPGNGDRSAFTEREIVKDSVDSMDRGETKNGARYGENGSKLSNSSSEELSRATLIWRAVKLPIYSVALIPLMVGASAAYYHTRVFDLFKFTQFLFYSILVIAWLNLSNDAYDAETGVDIDKKESVVNLTGSRTGVLIGAYACLLVGLGGILHCVLSCGDFRIFFLLLSAIACGYVYQCPPFRLSYKGLGEPLCFFAFGPFATTAFFLHQIGWVIKNAVITNTVLCASVLVGITTTLILFCSHFHQIESDLKVGKISPLVRMGTLTGSNVLKISVLALYAFSFIFVFGGLLPPSCLIAPIVTSPIGLLVINFVTKNHQNKSLIFMAKYYCVRLHVAFGIMLTIGLALGNAKPFMLFKPV